MKRFLSVLLVLMLCCGLAAAETLISVNGTGTVYVSADTATITLGISARETEVLDAQARVNTAIAAIRQALENAGVAKEDINTDYLSIYPIYDYNGEQEQLTGYSVSSSLAIRTQDLEQVGTLIDLAFAAGANTLSDISFSASDTADAEKEALTQAVENARSRAEVLCAAAGVNITGIQSVSDGYSYSYDSGVNNFSRVAKEEAAEADTVVQAAKLAVTASVSIVFEAE